MDKVLVGKIADCPELIPRKKHYYHSTKLLIVEKIFGKSQIRMGDFCGLNDSRDFKADCFLMCFSTQENESIPLWYLYSGVKGNGIRISFTSKVVDKICNGFFYYFDDIGEKKYITPDYFALAAPPIRV